MTRVSLTVLYVHVVWLFNQITVPRASSHSKSNTSIIHIHCFSLFPSWTPRHCIVIDPMLEGSDLNGRFCHTYIHVFSHCLWEKFLRSHMRMQWAHILCVYTTKSHVDMLVATNSCHRRRVQEAKAIPEDYSKIPRG